MNYFPLFELQVLVHSAVMGIIIGICVAFPILVIATANILVAFYATVTIGLITVSVVGTLPLAGWKLGVSAHIWPSRAVRHSQTSI